MGFDNTVPDPDNYGLDDIPAMQENFSLLESAQVVDEGSTSDGDYIRYENGWQICIFTFTDSNATFEEVGNVYRSESFDNIYFPNDFVENPKVISTSNKGLENIFGAKFNIELNYIDSFRVYSPVDRNQDIIESFIAIGRWK